MVKKFTKGGKMQKCCRHDCCQQSVIPIVVSSSITGPAGPQGPTGPTGPKRKL